MTSNYHTDIVAGAAANAATFNSPLGQLDEAITNTQPSQMACGRLTLTSNVPVTTADVLAAGTLYFTPYQGNRVALYDIATSSWKVYSFTERSLALTGLTANINRDIFLYDNGGTLTLEQVAWTNATTRAVALAVQDGVYVKTGEINKRYLGTIRTNATGQTEDSVVKRFVWNYYNRMPRRLRKVGSGPYTYTTSAWRQAADDATLQVEWVSGLSDDTMALQNIVDCVSTSGTYHISLGINTTTAATYPARSRGASSFTMTITAALLGLAVPLGYSYAAMVEFGGTGVTFDSSLDGLEGFIRG